MLFGPWSGTFVLIRAYDIVFRAFVTHSVTNFNLTKIKDIDNDNEISGIPLNINDRSSSFYEPRHEKICWLHVQKQRRGNRNRAADLRLCFRYIDSTINLLPKSEYFSLYPSSVFV